MARSRLVPQFALSEHEPQELRRLVKKTHAQHPILNDAFELASRAKFFQAVGHEVRLRIVGLLEVDSLCFCDLIKALHESPSTVAYHIHMLEDAGVIVRRENGKYTSFKLVKNSITRHHVLQ